MPLLLHVGRYLMTPPVLSGTTNVLDTGAPLGDWFKSAFLRFGTKVIDSRRDKKRTGGGKPSR
jgi:hypothetical protein